MELLRQDLLESNREPDGLLHASGDLVGPLRHSQLKLAGAPYAPNSLASQIRLATGTMWHDRMHNSIVASGVPFMQEVNVTPWLPEGWGGTADWLIWNDDEQLWDLKDLKTCKPEGLKWLLSGGVKVEHQWQLSAYWWALREAGFQMSERIEVMYLPMGDTTDDTVIEPLMLECDIIDHDDVQAQMVERWELTQQYLESLPGWDDLTVLMDHEYLTDELAPTMPREQKTFWVGRQSIWDVKLVPHWSAMFCPFDNALCDCSEQGVTKIGHYTLEGVYVPRTGYEDIAPEALPSEQDVRARRDAILSI